MNDLYRPMFLPDLLILGLERNGDRPAIYIDGEMRTAAELRDEISRYVQVFHAQGVKLGSGVATLSKNRVEVLYSMGAVMVSGCRNTPLHPLGSLDDHAYVLEDAQIGTLLFDPQFADRARELQERVPGLRRLLSYGEADVGDDLMALAATFVPQPLVAPPVDAEDLSALAYTGGTTGKPKGVMNTYRGSATMAQLMMSDLQWPDEVRHLICTPLSHAGSSLFVPLQLQGAAMFVLPTFDAGAVLEAIERHRITTTMLVPSMIYALLDHPTLRRDRPLEPADRPLRGVGDVAGAPARSDPEARPDLRPVLRADRSAHDGVRPAQGGPRRRRPRTTRVVRPTVALGAGRTARRRRQRGATGRTW